MNRTENEEKLKIGAVSYLNTKPLIYGLADEMGNVGQLILDLPSRLADRLRAEALDVALIPSFEFFQEPKYSIYSNACIACRGPVWSVKLLFRVPASQVKSIAVDEGSRTSVALTRVLMAHRYQSEPVFTSLPIDADPRRSETDAVLIIGDRAMRPCPPEFRMEWDLGLEWYRDTGLPFVFAMWSGAVREDSSESDWICKLLETARDRGCERIESIAMKNASDYGLSQEQCIRYLEHHLRFHLGLQERRGLQLFYDRCVSLGIAPEGLCFWNRDLAASSYSSEYPTP